MNWKKAAIDDLRCYRERCESLHNIRSRRHALAQEMSALKSSVSDAPRVHGGDARTEDKWLGIIVERERLAHNLRYARRLVEITERGLGVLTQEEQRVLELAYVDHRSGYVDDLCAELGYEQAHIYRIRDRALRRFTRAAYGCIED